VRWIIAMDNLHVMEILCQRVQHMSRIFYVRRQDGVDILLLEFERGIYRLSVVV
jgi:hypothetical protein